MNKNIDLANDKLVLGGHEFTSRFILGSGKFSLDLVKACIEKADAQIITLALRRANDGGLANILDYIPDNVTLLPNTSGARNADDAVRIARLSRELGCGDCVKIEIILSLPKPKTETFTIWEVMTPALPASCLLVRQSAQTRVSAQRNLSRF